MTESTHDERKRRATTDESITAAEIGSDEVHKILMHGPAMMNSELEPFRRIYSDGHSVQVHIKQYEQRLEESTEGEASLGIDELEANLAEVRAGIREHLLENEREALEQSWRRIGQKEKWSDRGQTA